MLFADETNFGTWGTTLAMIITTFIAYLTTRDRQRFDQEKVSLKEKVAQLTESHEACETAHKTTLDELCVVKGRCDAAELRSANRDGEMSGMRQIIEAMKAELERLRVLVVGR